MKNQRRSTARAKVPALPNEPRGSKSVQMNRRQAQAEETRKLLIKVARELFTTRGYHATGTEDLVAAAGVTRGALYHHFSDKQDLFKAVFEQIQGELVELSPRRARKAAGDHWVSIRKGIQTYLDLTLRPDVQRITLIDGPAVLGWSNWRGIQSRYAVQNIAEDLQVAMDEGSLVPQPSLLLAQLILAAIEEAALIIAHADDPRPIRNKVGAVLDTMLKSMTTK